MVKRIYHKVPERMVPKLVKRPQMTMADLAASTDLKDRQNSARVQLTNIREVKAPVGLKGFKVMRGDTITSENRHQHSVRIFYEDDGEDGKLTPSTKVICDCTCPRHCFYYEVANAKKGASFIYRSNGAPPGTTNPGMRPGLCKHAYRLMTYLLRKAGSKKKKKEEGNTQENNNPRPNRNDQRPIGDQSDRRPRMRREESSNNNDNSNDDEDRGKRNRRGKDDRDNQDE